MCETILYATVNVNTCHYIFVKTHKMNTKSGPQINYGLWGMVMR